MLKRRDVMAHQWSKWTPASDAARLPAERLAASANPDRLYRLLADGERRALLGVLLERDQPVSFEALQRRLAERGDSERAVGIRLVHVHLPKLDEADLVDYEGERGRVEATEAAADLAAAFPF